MKVIFFYRFFKKFSIGRWILFSSGAAAAGVLFLPLHWSVLLPGESRYEFQDRLIARENGFIFRTPGESSRRYRRGEVIFELTDPTLGFALERLRHMLAYDRILLDQQSTSRETIGDSILTRRKIASDIHAEKEILRKIDAGIQSAGRDLVFIPSIGKEDRGYFVRSGSVLGVLCSGKKIVRAYADDQEIKQLRIGQRAELFVKDKVFGVSGKVLNIHPIPVVLYDSPALQAWGGEVPASPDENLPDIFRSVHPVYCVDIVPERELPWQSGRFVRVKVSSRGVLAARIWVLIMSAFRRDVL